MTLPLPSVSDLETFIGTTGLDADRALMMIQGAYNRCSGIVSPLPDTAAEIVLGVAARAFANPEGVTSETVGPYSVQRPSNGLYLTKADKADLRRLAGTVTAFSIDTLPKGVSAVQSIAITGSPTGGTFTFTFAGQTTSALPYNVTAGALQTALQALPAFGAGNVAVTGSGPFTVTWQNDLATTPIATLTTVSSLTGGTSPAVTVVSLVDGVLAPGQGLPYWDARYLTPGGAFLLGSQ